MSCTDAISGKEKRAVECAVGIRFANPSLSRDGDQAIDALEPDVRVLVRADRDLTVRRATALGELPPAVRMTGAALPSSLIPRHRYPLSSDILANRTIR